MVEFSGGWTDPAPPPHQSRQVKTGSYEVVVFDHVIGRVVKCAPGMWSALSLNGTCVGPLEYHKRRDLATYALVMSSAGRAVWDAPTPAPVLLDSVELIDPYYYDDSSWTEGHSV